MCLPCAQVVSPSSSVGEHCSIVWTGLKGLSVNADKTKIILSQVGERDDGGG